MKNIYNLLKDYNGTILLIETFSKKIRELNEMYVEENFSINSFTNKLLTYDNEFFVSFESFSSEKYILIKEKFIFRFDFLKNNWVLIN